MFTANVGGIDRILRLVAGLVLVIAGFFFVTGTLGLILGIVGVVLVLTGLIGWCPLYAPFNFSTRRTTKLN